MLIFSLDTKKCMNALLLHPAFDSFLFIEGDITCLLYTSDAADD